MSVPETGADAPVQTTEAGSTGACVVRPACEACTQGKAGVCCVAPNPNPPPGPENVVSCNACAPDAGAKFVTLECNLASDCPSPQACCIEPLPNGGAHSFCAAGCDPVKNQAALCDANAVTETSCSPASPCSRNNIDDWNLPHCYGTCGGVGP